MKELLVMLAVTTVGTGILTQITVLLVYLDMHADLKSDNPYHKATAAAYFHDLQRMRSSRWKFVLRCVFAPWTLLK